MFRDALGPAVCHLSVTADDRCVLVSCCDSTLYLLDKREGGVLLHYRGHVLEGVRSECGLAKGDDWVVAGDEKGALDEACRMGACL